jgi:hypothetical protein
MSRNPRIEAIHAARYDWETASTEEKEVALWKLHRLLDAAIAASGLEVSRNQLLDTLYSDYKEFKRMKTREAWARLKK